MRIPWNDLSSKKFEELVGLLLRRMYGARPIDGSGGDGGRDAHYRDEAGYHIYEMKTFLTGRLSQGGRKGQIERSFEEAKKHSPDTWTLILGMIPTGPEGQWLDDLGAGSGVEVAWHGRDWLEEKLAQYPDIVRYFTEDATKQLLRELGNLQEMEQASLQGGVSDVLSRLSAFASQIDELSPHYRLGIDLDGPNIKVGLRPKYDGAELDHPLTFQIQVTEPDAARRFQEAMERLTHFGSPLEVSGEDAASVTVTPSPLLGEQFQPALIRILPTHSNRKFAIRASLVDDAGEEVAVQEMSVTHTGRGSKGLSLRAENGTRTLTVEIDLNFPDRTLHFHFYPTIAPGVSPAEMARTFAWIDELHNGLEVQVAEAESGALMFSGKSATLGESPARRDRRVLENLARIQEHSGVSFPVPDGLTVDDLFWIDRAVELLDTGKTEVPWSGMELGVVMTGDVDDLLAPGRQLMIDQTPIRVTIDGHDVVLGTGQVHFPDVVVANPSEVRSNLKKGSETKLQLVPGSSSQPYVLLLSNAQESESKAS